MASVAPENWRKGCQHYNRNCKLMAPCCGNIYSCRFCHDEEEDHTLVTSSVKAIMCTNCNFIQPVQYCCRQCSIRFGKYTCLKCVLFDNEDKLQFHCEGCEICRAGGKNNFFHCKTCNMCLAIRLYDNHSCIENASRRDCPVCMEDLHTSRNILHVPKCGHLLHKTCFEKLKESGHKTCPVCQIQDL